ncbi:MAG: hypothetical protein IPI67_07275 [Myxococcales bacterium]|nr:hypothetical protein [Myxococcales bacterium]
MALAASVVVGLCVAWGCGDDDNKTPKGCGDLPLYDVHDASPNDIAAREQAAAAGCVTKAGTATTSDNPPAGGAGGGGGAAGSAGAGGTTDSGAD